MGRIFYLLIILISLASPLTGDSLLRGRVLDGDSSAVNGARLAVSGGLSTVATSGPGGGFTLDKGILPAMVHVSHPDYEPLVISITQELADSSSGGIEIVLRARVVLSEEITVLAKSPSPGFAPGAAASATLETTALPENPATLLDMVQRVPGIAANGQGGLFQTYSIRGVSRHRVKSSVLNARLAGERRAGVSASFIDPFLFGSVDVLKGPAAAYHGSGSLGGVIRMVPRRFNGYTVNLGLRSTDSELLSAAGWGNDEWSVGFVRKEAGDASAPGGSLINSHFTQYSGLLTRSWRLDGGSVEVSLLPSLGIDIGKASTDYEQGRVTEYPYEKHLVAHFSMVLESGWDLSGFFHPHSYSTLVDDHGEVSSVENRSYDSGAGLRKEVYARDNTRVSLGGDYFSRSGVESIENQWSSASPAPSVPFYSLDGAGLNEIGLSGDIRHDLGFAVLEGGLRHIWSRNENRGMPTAEDSAWSGYGGIVVPAGRHLKIKGSTGTGIRFPGLSELFYGGTTARGSVEGNPDLEAERAFNLEGGLEWMGPNIILSSYVFRNSIGDYIERVEVDPFHDPDYLTYRNLTSGTIKGLEWELAASPLFYLDLVWKGHFIEGSDNNGDPLADIPVHRSTLGAVISRAGWAGGLSWQQRWGKDNPGSGEKVIGPVGLLDGFIRKSITPELDLRLSGSNLSNAEYHGSADKKVPLSPGLSIAVSIRWDFYAPQASGTQIVR